MRCRRTLTYDVRRTTYDVRGQVSHNLGQFGHWQVEDCIPSARTWAAVASARRAVGGEARLPLCCGTPDAGAGYPLQYRTFDTRAQAGAWPRARESEMDRGFFMVSSPVLTSVRDGPQAYGAGSRRESGCRDLLANSIAPGGSKWRHCGGQSRPGRQGLRTGGQTKGALTRPRALPASSGSVQEVRRRPCAGRPVPACERARCPCP